MARDRRDHKFRFTVQKDNRIYKASSIISDQIPGITRTLVDLNRMLAEQKESGSLHMQKVCEGLSKRLVSKVKRMDETLRGTWKGP